MIKNSLSFLMIARNELAGSCNSISNKNVASILRNYIINEASDYEVISTLVYGKPPKDKYNSIKERLAWADLKVSITENWETVSHAIPKKTIHTILEMGPIMSYGFSSAKPIVETHLLSGKYDFISETGDKSIDDAQEIADEIRWKNIRHDINQKRAEDARSKDIADDSARILAKEEKERAIENKPITSKEVTSPKVETKHELTPQEQDHKDRYDSQSDWSNSKHDAIEASDVAKKDLSKQMDWSKERSEEIGKENLKLKKEWGTDTKEETLRSLISKHLSNPIDAIKDHPFASGLAAAAASALIAYGAYKVYQSKFSASSKACSDLSGREKDVCVNRYKQNAIHNRILQLQKGLTICNKSKNSHGCKQKIHQQILKNKNKLRK